MSHLDPTELVPARSPRLIWIITIALLVSTGLVGVGVVFGMSRSSGLDRAIPAASHSASSVVNPTDSQLPAAVVPATSAPALPDEVTNPAVRRDAIERVLRDRADDVILGSVAALAGQQVPHAAVPDFAGIHSLSPVSFDYSVTSISSSSDPTQATVSALVSYRLPMDSSAATFREDLALQHSDTGWRIAAEHSVGRKPIWELGSVSHVVGKRATVIGIDQTSATLQRYLAIADAVIPDVTTAWGSDWYQHVVIVVPKTVQQLESALGRGAESLEDIAAVTSMEAAPGHPGANRIWLNTPTMQGLSSVGREIVVRHEVVHVATDSGSTDATPLWLEEGLAEYIGYQDTGVTRRVAVGGAIDAVRDGRTFTQLPSDDDFSGSDLSVAYESALVACDELVGDGGIARLVKIYRLTAQGSGSSDENVSAAIHQVYGINLDEFVLRWDKRLHRLAGVPRLSPSPSPTASSSVAPVETTHPSPRPTPTHVVA